MSKEFNQRTFNTVHKEPRDYGEGNYYIVSNKYTTDEAAKIINEWEEMLTGAKADFKPEDITDMKMFVSNKNDDGVDDWCVNNWSDEKPVAWGIGYSL